MMRSATKRAWLTKDRSKLVPDGHAEAAVLFARAGQQMPEDELKKIKNASEFFPSTGTSAPRPQASKATVTLIPAKPKAPVKVAAKKPHPKSRK